MRRPATRICFALLALVFAALPASAPAANSLIGLQARFELKASDGYKASVVADSGKVLLTFTKEGNGRQEEVEYVVNGATTRKGLKARFGSLGRISVKFTPTRPGGTRGVYTGTIRFRGEGGYVVLDATRARGALLGSARRAPGSSADGSAAASADPVFAVLAAGTQGRLLLAIASHPDEPDLPAFAAATREHGGGMEIVRQVTAFGSADSFSFEDNLSTATIRPPAPFSGGATFTRNPDGSKSWSGDLVVDLPGRADVPMVGPRFELALKHDLF
jgi:hypothetical protein